MYKFPANPNMIISYLKLRTIHQPVCPHLAYYNVLNITGIEDCFVDYLIIMALSDFQSLTILYLGFLSTKM